MDLCQTGQQRSSRTSAQHYIQIHTELFNGRHGYTLLNVLHRPAQHRSMPTARQLSFEHLACAACLRACILMHIAYVISREESHARARVLYSLRQQCTCADLIFMYYLKSFP